MKTMLLHILTMALVLGGAAGLARADSGLLFSLSLDRGGPAISIGAERYVSDAGPRRFVPPPPPLRHVAPPRHRHPMRGHCPQRVLRAPRIY